ncbi:pyrroloquinoline quinone biosynthesis protein PqqD [Salinisphaera orenii MK-B5]|uniref:PqqA binding protein n=1 Tax=Salinisphaera orenii MK-B5 TaxID=856730 RepID=A0A423PWF1_9GAMM|nr:pyrroloquinoline quinone biosynthesis peptide chaperone PqqD [Salinisphaera orenii]ROO29899.1 pyrroloquinoline quinone biosynthesis protein PqqD [Salinisphaera orenii MK-B5]
MNDPETTPPEIRRDAVPRIARGHRLQFEPAQDCHVLLYPEGMVTLNPSAAEILGRCDGARTVAELCAALSADFGGAAVDDDVHHFLQLARSHGWVTLD